MSNKFFTLGDADKNGTFLGFDFYLSEDAPPAGTPPKKILKHKKAEVHFRNPRDAQTFFDILTMGIQRFEIMDE